MKIKQLLSIFALSLLSLCSGCMECMDCSAPPTDFRFQLVDILGNDRTIGKRALYTNTLVSLDYVENGVEKSVELELDTLEEGKTIFKAAAVPALYNKGIVKYHLYCAPGLPADTLVPEITNFESYCCEYIVYKELKANGLVQERSVTDNFVFLVQK